MQEFLQSLFYSESKLFCFLYWVFCSKEACIFFTFQLIGSKGLPEIIKPQIVDMKHDMVHGMLPLQVG
jgi:hypothetical protein